MATGMETAGSCILRTGKLTASSSGSFQGDGGAATACLLAQEVSLRSTARSPVLPRGKAGGRRPCENRFESSIRSNGNYHRGLFYTSAIVSSLEVP